MGRIEFYNLEARKAFQTMTQNLTTVKDGWNNTLQGKATISKVERPSGGKIFVTQITVRELISLIYKELLETKKIKRNNAIGGKRMIKNTDSEIQRILRHKPSKLGEMQINKRRNAY